MAESFAGDGHCGPAGDKQPAALHIYAHNYFHGPCALVGNRAGLIRLRDLLNAVLDGTARQENEEPAPAADFVPADDGEGYTCFVFLHDLPFRDPSWRRMPVHYAAQDWPEQRVAAGIRNVPFLATCGCPDCQGDVRYSSWPATRGVEGADVAAYRAALAEHKKTCTKGVGE